jgi:orotate phosphoribosyltransferase
MNILKMSREELLGLNPDSMKSLNEDELLHIFRELDGLWLYDYEAEANGNVPEWHAELKSKRHSDGFLNSHEVLVHDNIRMVIANKLTTEWEILRLPRPDYVAGIPRGATELGKDVAQIMKVPVVDMTKEEDGIKLVSTIEPGKSLLLVEDFCTRGTGLKEAVTDIVTKFPSVKVLRYELVVINRGGMDCVNVDDVGSFDIIALKEHRIQDWLPEDCPLCKKGSKPIKPKADEENWKKIMAS